VGDMIYIGQHNRSNQTENLCTKSATPSTASSSFHRFWGKVVCHFGTELALLSFKFQLSIFFFFTLDFIICSFFDKNNLNFKAISRCFSFSVIYYIGFFFPPVLNLGMIYHTLGCIQCQDSKFQFLNHSVIMHPTFVFFSLGSFETMYSLEVPYPF